LSSWITDSCADSVASRHRVSTLAAIVPLPIWNLTLEKPARVERFVVDYSVLRQDGRWLPVPLLDLVVVVLWYLVNARGRGLRALADSNHVAAVGAEGWRG
jgi:hypothetical protein